MKKYTDIKLRWRITAACSLCVSVDHAGVIIILISNRWVERDEVHP